MTFLRRPGRARSLLLLHPTRCVFAALCLFSAARGQVAGPEREEVRIHYDALRIPHVFAESDEGVFFGLGYTQARDFPVATLANLWSATGRYGEVAGALVLPRDERVRLFGIDELARAQAEEEGLLAPEIRRFLAAYVEGVNAGRRWWLEEPARLDALAGESGQMWIDPVPGWLCPLLTKDDLRKRLQRLFGPGIELFHVLAFGIAVNAGVDFPGHGYGLATNLWFVRNDEKSRKVVSCIDTHQPLKRAGLRSYFLQLSGSSYDVAGYTIPGHPCLLVGFNRDLAWGLSSLPKVPLEIARAGLPFRPVGTTPVTKNAWEARLEPDLPLRLALEGGEIVPLEERRVTLRYWDVESAALVSDPRGELCFYRVPETSGSLAGAGLFHPVVDPRPGAALEPAAQIRFEGRTYLCGRNLWESWIELGRARRVGQGEGGIDRLLEQGSFSFGRGESLVAVDVTGGLEYVWIGRFPIQGAHALEQGPAALKGVLDGHDPLARWQGFHPSTDWPRLLDGPGFGEHAEAWLNCNVSPHYVRPGSRDFAFDGPATIYDGSRWKTPRQDRARELFERALADGAASLEEVQRIALDVQDPWSRSRWPLVLALRSGEDPPSALALRFLAWVEVLRFEGPDGAPGEEEFLAHPLSQVTPFLVLLRDALEERLLALPEAAGHELGFSFDPVQALPSPAEFTSQERWRRCRDALKESLEFCAALFEATLEEREEGLANRRVLPELVAQMKACGGLFADAWDDPLYRAQGQGWGDELPQVPLRWGQVNVYSLTPHQFPNLPRRSTPFDEWVSAVFRPCELEGDFFRSMTPVVFPFGGTRDSMYQSHREGVLSYRQALFPGEEGRLLLAPINFGIQIPFCVELAAGSRPRAQVMPAMAATEILCPLPASDLGALEQFRTTRDFAARRWSELVLEEEALEKDPAVRSLCVQRARR